MSNNIFPNNLLGTHANFVNINETNNIFICGDYQGHYEDDDCDFLFFNKETNEFWTDSWTTRGACTNSPWNVPCVDIDCVEDEALINAIKTAAKKKIVSDMDKIRKDVVWSLYNEYDRYTRKAGMEKAKEVLMGIDYTDDVNAIDNLPQLISFFHSHASIKTTCRDFYDDMVDKYAMEILKENQKKARSIKLYGKDYTGEVFMVKYIETRFGLAAKVGIKCGDNNVYALLNSCDAEKGDTITINGTINEQYSSDGNISLSGARRIDNIDPARIVRCGDAANTDTTTDNSANATDKTDNADTTDTKTDKVAAKKKDMPMTQVYANVAKETEKAYQFNVAYWTKIDQPQKNATMWCPKSCCTITEKEVFIADFILNKWVADYEERIRQHTSRIPNVMFDVMRIESAKANEEDKKRIEEKRYAEAEVKARPIADGEMRLCGEICKNFSTDDDNNVVNQDVVAEIREFGKKLEEEYGVPTNEDRRNCCICSRFAQTDGDVLRDFAFKKNYKGVRVELNRFGFYTTYYITTLKDYEKNTSKIGKLMKKLYGEN